jgi:hypothetical protein
MNYVIIENLPKTMVVTCEKWKLPQCITKVLVTTHLTLMCNISKLYLLLFSNGTATNFVRMEYLELEKAANATSFSDIYQYSCRFRKRSFG